MSQHHLKPIGLPSRTAKRTTLKPSPSLSCDYVSFSYPIIPETPRLDATTKADVQKRAAA